MELIKALGYLLLLLALVLAFVSVIAGTIFVQVLT